MVLAAEHSFFSGRSLWQLILGGAFDRFPEPKIAFIETETWWIAPMIGLLDRREQVMDDWTEFGLTLGQMKPYSRMPSEYWLSNCYAGISPFHPSQIEASARWAAPTATTTTSRSTATTRCSESTTRTRSRSSRT